MDRNKHNKLDNYRIKSGEGKFGICLSLNLASLQMNSQSKTEGLKVFPSWFSLDSSDVAYILKDSNISADRPDTQRSYYKRHDQVYQYLKKSTQTDCMSLQDRLGRPTRSALLRYEKNKKTFIRPKTAQTRLCSESFYSNIINRNHYIKDTYENLKKNSAHIMSDGESLYAYSIGSRYNWNNVVDKRSLDSNGIYIPRKHPEKSFTTKKSSTSPNQRNSPKRPNRPKTSYRRSRNIAKSISSSNTEFSLSNIEVCDFDDKESF
ncbi:hypothetical protein A3Q56_00703 [Intoshia linei]|uniref:Uncharacterized protein n=1 Tax=Intoshia linei TaxID=1819745 RepID=A0A177BD22_9BILA|nr:hypothetical protein A3Q56_00703 [Intoshia linei]